MINNINSAFEIIGDEQASQLQMYQKQGCHQHQVESTTVETIVGVSNDGKSVN
jgi:hypothetical protein